jgi:hypothetical protein
MLSPFLVAELLLIESLYRNRVGLTDFDFLNSIGLGALHHSLNLLTYASWFTEPGFQLSRSCVTAWGLLQFHFILYFAINQISYFFKPF